MYLKEQILEDNQIILTPFREEHVFDYFKFFKDNPDLFELTKTDPDFSEYDIKCI